MSKLYIFMYSIRTIFLMTHQRNHSQTMAISSEKKRKKIQADTSTDQRYTLNQRANAHTSYHGHTHEFSN